MILQFSYEAILADHASGLLLVSTEPTLPMDHLTLHIGAYFRQSLFKRGHLHTGIRGYYSDRCFQRVGGSQRMLR